MWLIRAKEQKTMKGYHICKLFLLLLIAGISMNACSSQIDSSATKGPTLTSKPSPKIIGTPPPSNPTHNPYNDSNLVSQYIRSIFQDSKGNYWFGPAGQSVARYDEKTLEYFSKDEFFQGNETLDRDNGLSVHAITEDRKGNIWFGTNYGAIKFDPDAESAGGNAFKSYTEKHGLSNPRVGRNSIFVDNSGEVWVGTQRGVFQYNLSADTDEGICFTPFDLLPPIHATDIMEDKEGNIWFASKNSGVFRYDPTAEEAGGKAITNITEKAGLGDNVAGGIAQDKMGNMWFTMKGGICRYDPSAEGAEGKLFTEFTTEDGIGGSEIWGMLIEDSGIIWITARGSTTRFDPSVSGSEAFRVFTVADGLNCCVQSMHQDRSGNVWWGTGQGLYRFDGERFYQVKQQGPW